MKKVFVFSCLLLLGLFGSQWLPSLLSASSLWIFQAAVKLLNMFCLGFIMIGVGYEFEIDKSKLGQYGKDYLVAATSATLPWLFCALYFIFAMSPREAWNQGETWKLSLFAARFAAPTATGILFSMLAAAGLASTWVYRKTRILVIFDDLDTVLLMIPLKFMVLGLQWQLVVVVLLMVALLGLAWTFLHRLRWSVQWPWMMLYAAAITLFSEWVYHLSKKINEVLPIHFEVILPAFVLGCLLARPPGSNPHADDSREGHQEGPEASSAQRVLNAISALFMVLVGLSMPAISGMSGGASANESSWGTISLHVLLITLLANLGKMFPLFCYRSEVSWRQRLALCLAMCPRGEVGAGILILSMAYGVSGASVLVAMLSLTLNLILTGVFIYFVKALLSREEALEKASNLVR